VTEDNGDGQRRRERDRTVDQNLRFTTTITFVISMIAITATAVRMYGVIDNRLSEAETVIERLMTRQNLYIERDQGTHAAMDEAMDEMHHESEDLLLYLAARFGEALP